MSYSATIDALLALSFYEWYQRYRKARLVLGPLTQREDARVARAQELARLVSMNRQQINRRKVCYDD